MTKYLRPFLMLAALTAASAAPAFADILNGNFATGDFTDWTLTGNTGYTGVTMDFDGVTPPGSSVYEAYFGAIGSETFLSQTFADAVGADTLTFSLYNFGGTPSEFSATVGSDLLYFQTNSAAFGWTTFNFGYTGTGSDTVTFSFQQNPSYFLFDNVSATSSTATPEPSSLILLGTGLIGAAGAARRKFRKA